MADGAFDFAIIGATPLASLLAGLLATEHGKRVCLVGEPWSPYRLRRRIDLSVAPFTRPDSWALMKRGTAETLKLLSGIGKGLYERVDPVFIAETPASIDRLGHMRYVALGTGVAAEKVVERTLRGTGDGCRVRDAVALVGGRVEPALESWLDRSGVHRIGGADARMTLRHEGGCRILADGTEIEAVQAVLPDDVAILSHLSARDRDRVLRPRPMTAFLTEPAKALGSQLLHYVDRGAMLHQRGGKGPIFALADGTREQAVDRVGSALAAHPPLRQVAQAVFDVLDTVDGAPLVSIRPNRAVITGFGAVGAFFAPPLARFLAGGSDGKEQAWFAAHDSVRGNGRAAVAEAVEVTA